MRKLLMMFLVLIGPSAFASPVFEGLTWMTNVGLSVALTNLIFGVIVMQTILRPNTRVMIKSLGFGVVQFVLAFVSIPLSWFGTSWLVYWIKGLEGGGNALFVIGLFILPACSLTFMFYRDRKSA